MGNRGQVTDGKTIQLPDQGSDKEIDFFYNPNTQLEVPAEIDAEAFLLGLDHAYNRLGFQKNDVETFLIHHRPRVYHQHQRQAEKMRETQTNLRGGHNADVRPNSGGEQYTGVAARIKSFSQAMEASGYVVKGFETYTGDAETLNQMQTAFIRLANDFPSEAKGLTIQLSQTEEPDTIGWFDDESWTIHYNQMLFRNWEEAQVEYAISVREGHFPVGTDARSRFYHEFGHVVWYSRGGGSLRKAVDATLKRLGYGHVNVSQRAALIRKELSGYATERTPLAYHEVIAEAFSEWYSSNKPRRFCKEFLKEVGLIGNL